MYKRQRLLCELATHKDFIKFLADIEIYVDGIATMQIQNLNSLVDTVRHEIIERYRPGEDDPHLKVLQAAHISDDEYFSHMVRDEDVYKRQALISSMLWGGCMAFMVFFSSCCVCEMCIRDRYSTREFAIRSAFLFLCSNRALYKSSRIGIFSGTGFSK